MAVTLSTAQKTAIQNAIDLMVVGTAPELPFDAKIIETVAPVAEAIGFIPPLYTQATNGAFQESCKLRPISTLLALAKFIGT